MHDPVTLAQVARFILIVGAGAAVLFGLAWMLFGLTRQVSVSDRPEL